MEFAELASILRHRVPDGALPLFTELLRSSRLALRIVRGRATKLGDFRYPRLRGEPPRITINENLNPYAFSITLAHEIAHLRVWERYNRSASRPHGEEWKREYRATMKVLLEGAVFPGDLRILIQRHIQNPAATTTGDPVLLRAIRQYDGDLRGRDGSLHSVNRTMGYEATAGESGKSSQNGNNGNNGNNSRERSKGGRIYLEDLEPGALFSLDGYGSFEKGKKLRKRYECRQIRTRRMYRIHPLAEVLYLGNERSSG